jgi:hypothetical protein
MNFKFTELIETEYSRRTIGATTNQIRRPIDSNIESPTGIWLPHESDQLMKPTAAHQVSELQLYMDALLIFETCSIAHFAHPPRRACGYGVTAARRRQWRVGGTRNDWWKRCVGRVWRSCNTTCGRRVQLEARGDHVITAGRGREASAQIAMAATELRGKGQG